MHHSPEELRNKRSKCHWVLEQNRPSNKCRPKKSWSLTCRKPTSTGFLDLTSVLWDYQQSKMSTSRKMKHTHCCLCKFSVHLKWSPKSLFNSSVVGVYLLPHLLPFHSVLGPRVPFTLKSPWAGLCSVGVPSQFAVGHAQLLIFLENWCKNVLLEASAIQTSWLNVLPNWFWVGWASMNQKQKPEFVLGILGCWNLVPTQIHSAFPQTTRSAWLRKVRREGVEDND